MGLSFTVQLAMNFEYFERLYYSLLYYAFKTEIEQFTATFCGLTKVQTTNSIYVLLPWIFFFNIKGKGGRSSP